jgi:hypothetical protein
LYKNLINLILYKMKYKVLSLLVLTIITYSRFLKSKTTQGQTFTLNVTPPEGNDLKTFYVFCTDDSFKDHYENFDKRPGINTEINSWGSEAKEFVADLTICIYNLKNDDKITLRISELESPITYNKDNGTWDVKTKSEGFVVHGRFDEVIVDFPSELLDITYYTTAYLHFMLTNPAILDPKDPINVYTSFMYCGIVNKYYAYLINFEANSGLTKVLDNLKELVETVGFGSDIVKKTTVSEIIKNQELLSSIYENNLDIIFLIITDRMYNDRKSLDEVCKNLNKLLFRLGNLGKDFIDHLKVAIESPIFHLIFRKLESFKQFKSLRRISSLPPGRRNTLLKNDKNKPKETQWQQPDKKENEGIQESELQKTINYLLDRFSGTADEVGSKIESVLALYNNDNFNNLTCSGFLILKKLFSHKRGYVKRVLNETTKENTNLKIFKCKVLIAKLFNLYEITNILNLFENQKSVLNDIFVLLSKFPEEFFKLEKMYPNMKLNDAFVLDRLLHSNDIDSFSRRLDIHSKLVKKEYNRVKYIILKNPHPIDIKRRTMNFINNFVKPVMSVKNPKSEMTLETYIKRKKEQHVK